MNSFDGQWFLRGNRMVKVVRRVVRNMPKIQVSTETVERLDTLRIEDETYDEIITELINIYEAEELTLFRSGDG